MSTRPLVLYTEPLAEEAVHWLAQQYEVAQCDADDPKFAELLSRAAGLIVRTYLQVDDALLDNAPNLRVVGRAGIGLENIHVPACRKRNIEVVYTPDASTQAVIEYVLALVFDAIRPREALHASVDMKQWSGYRKRLVGKRELGECVVGMLGLGRIGSRLAQVLAPFGCRVIYNDVLDIAISNRHGAEPVSVEELFAQSDVLSIHIDARPSNNNFVNDILLSLMKQDVVLVNASRGVVLDAHALAVAMQTRPNAHAMIDVHEPEPFSENYPLLNMPNVFLYPHLASRTDRGLLNMSWVVRDIAAVLEGQSPAYPAP